MDKYKKLQEIISRVKREHDNGKDLKVILKQELKKAGLDPNKICLEDALDSTADFSELLDQYIFEPWFCSHAGSLENGVLDALVQFGHSRKIEETLTLPKMFLTSLSIILFMASIVKFKSNPIYGLLYLLLSHDSLRMSYNCFSKRYYSLAGGSLVANPQKVASTVYTFLVGSSVANDPDPLSEIKDKVQWELIVDSTFCKYAYEEAAPIIARQYKEAVRNQKQK